MAKIDSAGNITQVIDFNGSVNQVQNNICCFQKLMQT